MSELNDYTGQIKTFIKNRLQDQFRNFKYTQQTQIQPLQAIESKKNFSPKQCLRNIKENIKQMKEDW